VVFCVEGEIKADEDQDGLPSLTSRKRLMEGGAPGEKRSPRGGFFAPVFMPIIGVLKSYCSVFSLLAG
jgi:hypothetical protein